MSLTVAEKLEDSTGLTIVAGEDIPENRLVEVRNDFKGYLFSGNVSELDDRRAVIGITRNAANHGELVTIYKSGAIRIAEHRRKSFVELIDTLLSEPKPWGASDRLDFNYILQRLAIKLDAWRAELDRRFEGER